MKSLIFIGGTGILGNSFIDYLNKGKLKNIKLSKIIIISRKKKRIKSKVKITYINKDLADLKKLPFADYIIHAANSKTVKENIKGVYNLKKIINDKHKKTKILFISSGSVYGSRNFKKKFNENEKIDLKKALNFKSYKKNYSKSKIVLENEFKKLSLKGYSVSIARLFTLVGKRILVNSDYAITDLINQAKNINNKQIILNSSNDVYRTYMNTDDIVRWIIKILINASPNCDIYNVGSDEIITVAKLAKLIAKHYKKTVCINRKIGLKNKKIDFYVPSIKKAHKNLNLKITKRIDQSLLDLYNY